MKRVLVLHGPNLNLLGSREPDIYGSITLQQIDERLRVEAESKGVEIRTVQSNHEGVLVDEIQGVQEWGGNGIIINPGAYAHSSVAIRDALRAVAVPAVEVHLSNVYGREPFRRRLVVSPACRGVITGLGWRGYLLALDALLNED